MHNLLFPGFNLTWKIPVGFYRDDSGASKVTLSGIACELVLFDETYRIPRKMYLPFFKDSLKSGRFICDSTDEIRNAFDYDANETLIQILGIVGFIRIKSLSNIPILGGTRNNIFR